MKKVLVLFVMTFFFMAHSKAASSPVTGTSLLTPVKLELKKLAVQEAVSQLMTKLYCTDCTFYLSCGYVWGGDVCVDHPVFTSQDFDTAWNFKNIQLCGGGGPN